ncbi:hypothetical protein ACIBP6_15015 [Nonomuraea terrae]|uniref:hypothetical protein n=1 Tax=Nonomuraea terrae TaxID=2530383 RepID=UPI00379E6AB7
MGTAGSVRGRLTLMLRAGAEAVAGGYVGHPRRPSGLILGRYDGAGRLRVVGRTTRLTARAAAEVALCSPRLPCAVAHPWPIRGASVAEVAAAECGVQSVRPARPDHLHAGPA